jgi:Phosphodiester glycosidase
VPKLQYNAYLLSTTSTQSLQIIVPFIPSSISTAITTSTIEHNKNIAKRVERNGVTANPFIGCTKRLGFTKSRSETAENRDCYYRSNAFLQRTTIQSRNHHCRYAMNGSPFNAGGSSVGVVIVPNGTFISTDFGPNIGFGTATKPAFRNGTNNTILASYWVIGRIDNITQARTLGIEQFVTGFDWLVYNYSNIALYRNNTTGAIRASLSTIGITSDGTLLLLVTDGCEHW